ncbi:MAG: hypothetical protein U0X20_29340 [Caldilineaceae bacterium]
MASSRLHIVQIIRVILLFLMLPLLAGCPPVTGDNITIVQNDSTAPELTVGIGQPEGESATASDGGSPASIKLTKKSGPLNVLVAARDGESGIQALRVDVVVEVTTCDASQCVGGQPPFSGAPTFDYTEPRKNPGDATAESITWGRELDLTMYIPQDNVAPGKSRFVDVIFTAAAVNHLGRRTLTPAVKARWSEP